MKLVDFRSVKMRGLIKNRYFITLVVFLVWILFFDKTNVKNWIGESIKTNRLEREKAYYEKEIIRVDNQLNLLRSNNDSLERYAREQFYMKKDNEEIYLIEE